MVNFFTGFNIRVFRGLFWVGYGVLVSRDLGFVEIGRFLFFDGGGLFCEEGIVVFWVVLEVEFG